jgi:hypothetical protein
MYIPDLSFRFVRNTQPELEMLSVGWLDNRHAYNQGATTEEFRKHLFHFCLYPILQTRGTHHCEFCQPKPHYAAYAKLDGQELWMGSAEIRVVHKGKVYAAPNLIYHYVVEHNYKPPDEFIEAVLHGLSPDSEEYRSMKDQYWSWDCVAAANH